MHQQPEILDIGPLSLVLPIAGKRLTPRGWADLSCAVILQACGDTSPALQLIASIEERLGVNPAHRRALVIGSDAVLRQIREDKRRRRLAEHQRSASLRAEPLRPTPEMLEVADRSLAALADAARAYRDGNRTLSNEKRLESRVLADTATGARERQIEVEDQRLAALDRKALAQTRDEELITEDFDMKVPVMVVVAGTEMLVERLQRVVRIRNVTRDGLASLRQERIRQEEAQSRTGKQAKGGLTLRQYQFGLRYRDMFEAHDGGLGSQFRAILSGGGSGRQPEVPIEMLAVPRQLARQVDGSRALEALEAAVATTDRTGRRLHLLREVAGRGRNVREMASSGSLREAYRDALAAALDVVVEHLHQARA